MELAGWCEEEKIWEELEEEGEEELEEEIEEEEEGMCYDPPDQECEELGLVD